MPWWAWLVVGAVLVGVELVAADAAFYFIFIGVSALLVGLVQLFGVDMAAWQQWLLFGVVAVASMVLFREKLYERLRGNLPGFDNTMTGAVVDVRTDVMAGGETRVRLRGTDWSARNIGASAIAGGDQARVVGMHGTMLDIIALNADATAPESPTV